MIYQVRPRLVAAFSRIAADERLGHGQIRMLTNAPAPKDEAKSPTSLEKGAKKFTLSQAYLNYRSSDNFHGGDDRDLPKSHNFVIAGTGIFGFYYLIFARDDIEADGGKALFKPLHETVPELAIPLIEAAIAENRKFGNSTTKLEAKLEELMREPEKHGGGRRKLIEN